MTYNQFEFSGLQNYEKIADKLFLMIEQVFGFKDEYYQQAVEEAVCNAGRYSVYGPEQAKILINIRVAAYDIAVTIISKTHPFDALAYQKKLRSLANDTRYADMDWGDYVGLTTASSGFWYMLTGVDYLFIDSIGQSITLSKNTLRRAEMNVSTKISMLVPRFFVRDNGVII